MIEKTELFPTIVYSSHLKYFTDDYLNIIENCKRSLLYGEKWKDNTVIHQTYSSNLHKDKTYKVIVDFFDESLKQIKETCEYDTEKFKITLMWANKTSKQGFHRIHYHPNSYFSGVFYLSSGAPTVFKDPNIFRAASLLNVASNEPKENAYYTEPGSLLIFPSWLYHGTHDNDTDSRMTISFNTLPSGETNYGSEEHLFSRMNIDCL